MRHRDKIYPGAVAYLLSPVSYRHPLICVYYGVPDNACFAAHSRLPEDRPGLRRLLRQALLETGCAEAQDAL